MMRNLQDLNEVEVLLVEDNPSDAELTMRALKKKNLANKLFHVKDGAEAIDFIFAEGGYVNRRVENGRERCAERQEEIVQAVYAQDENPDAVVRIKPDDLGDLMRRRDALEDRTFADVMNDLRAADRGAHERVKALQTEHRTEQRKHEQDLLNELIPEAFGALWEAARRTVGMRPYDVQLVGGIVLHEGKIAEMKTGEGKTLVATLPAYLNALTVQYAKELAGTGILVNAGCPGFVATDLNGHQGTRTPEQGAAVFLTLATLPDGGPTGTFRDEEGIQPW